MFRNTLIFWQGQSALAGTAISPSCNSEIAISEFKVLGSHQE